MSPAVLFDVDGTLVDSNYLHVHAWIRAFGEAGVPVDAWRIHRSIGMDGETMLATLASDADEDAREKAQELHSRYYRDSAPLLRRLPGARELLERIHALGLQVVLATSAPEDELAMTRKVLACDDLLSAVTSSEDVGTAKPRPDIIEVALQRAGVDAHDAVYVGDAVWDVEACKRAGVVSLAVLTGGVSRGELENAGAQEVFDSAQELCERISETPIAALAATVEAR